MKTAVIFHETGVVRLFESYNLAQATFFNCDHRLITRPSELPPKFGRKLPKTYERVLGWALDRQDRNVGPRVPTYSWPSPSDWSEMDYANAIWRIAMACGDLTTSPITISETNKRESGYVIDIAAAKRVYEGWVAKTIRLPKQAAMLAKWFLEEGFDFYTKDEMRRNTVKLSFVQAIETKQDPWRIMRYYTPILEQHGVIKEH